MSESPKTFETVEEYLPLSKAGFSTFEEFRIIEQELREKELLKRIGLADEEILLYHENESGSTVKRSNIEKSVLEQKLKAIYAKILAFQYAEKEIESDNESPTPSTSNKQSNNPSIFYPQQHPINSIKDLEEDLFGHLDVDQITPLTKRRKLLRRIQRKLDHLENTSNGSNSNIYDEIAKKRNPNTLWDVKELPKKVKKVDMRNDRLVGPKLQTMYTIKDNKIVRLEPIEKSGTNFRTVDIIQPKNKAEEKLLEGTKLSLDEIKSISRFKDYTPGEQNKVLFLKNISDRVTEEDLSTLFCQFDNKQEKVNVKLMSGKLRGQAFVSFPCENQAKQALEAVNGIVLKGKPIIVQFSKNKAIKS